MANKSLAKKEQADVESYNLSKAQTRLLEVLRDPNSIAYTAEEICKKANITRGTYYTSFKDQDFIKALDAEMLAYRNANDFAVMHNLVNNAKIGKNHQVMALFERLQNRMVEGATRPAQIILVFEGVERPEKLNKLREANLKIIEGEAKVVKDGPDTTGKKD